MASRPGDYFGFTKQEDQSSVDDTTPLLEKIKNALENIEDLLRPQTANVINAIQSVVNLTATRLLPQNAGRKSFIIRNTGASSIYIGDQNVTTNSGFQLLIADALTAEGFTGEIYAVADGVGGAATIIEG